MGKKSGKGGADLYCFGYVHYRDDVKRLRTTAFCRMLKFTNRLGPLMGYFGAADPPEPDYEYED
jgi:hypothetical protein